MAASFFQQWKALTWRNFLYKKRKKAITLQEIFFPIWFILLLGVIKLLILPARSPAIPSFPSEGLAQADYMIETNGTFIVTPDSPEIIKIMDRTMAFLNITAIPPYVFVSNASEAEALYAKNASLYTAGIGFNVTSDGSYIGYTIRMDVDKLPINGVSGLPDDFTGGDTCRSGGGKKDTNCPANHYLFSGFATLQLALETAIIQVISQAMGLTLVASAVGRNKGINKVRENIAFKMPNITIEMMPKPEYNPDASAIQIISSLYFVMSFAPLVNFLTILIVAEKEKKIKEALKIMGMRDSAFWCSWASIYAVFILIISIVGVIMVVALQFFQRSNVFIFFLLLFLYGLSVIAFSFLMSTFFTKARVAGAVTSFTTTIFSMLYLVVVLTKDQTTGITTIPPAAQWALCLLSPAAFALGIDLGIGLDIYGAGMTFDTITLGPFPLYAPITMLVVDTILYTLLAAYLDNIIPQEYGQTLPPWFFLDKAYWFPQRRSEHLTGSDIELTDDMEDVGSHLKDKNVIKIRNIKKTFRSKKGITTAVDNISLDIYENQITCLLGHNGAGKTTLMNMLTGMLSPNSGHATVYGLDATNTSDMIHIRSMVGFCPQHNILLDPLSCQEHLEIFANIKGIPKESIKKQVIQALDDVGLTDQKFTYAEKLSGGQKRKLCIAIALIGDPKVLFLDEPTSGIDPFSRRHLWTLLQAKKENRVIVLTTHFMDEADVLADRKAVISKGKLRCLGSSLFLKNRFGLGYHLNIVTDGVSGKQETTALVKSLVDGADDGRAHGMELSFTLPLDQVGKFSALFDQLDAKGSSLGIQSYGISMTTLEEVFLKLGEDEEVIQSQKSSGFRLSGKVAIATEKTYLSSSVQRNAENDSTSSISSESYDDMMSRIRFCKTKAELSTNRIRALMKVRVLLTMRNFIAVYMRMFLPIVFIALGLVFIKILKKTVVGVNPLKASLTLANYTDPLYYRNLTGENIDGFVGGLVAKSLRQFFQGTNLSDLAPISLAFDVNKYIPGTQVSPDPNSFTIYYNDTAVYSLVQCMNIISNSLLPNVNLELYSFPWPTTQIVTGVNINSFFSLMFLGMAINLIPCGYAVEIVRDRQCKAKGQLRVAGVTQKLYWGSIFLLDYIQYFIPAIISLIALGVARVESVDHIGAFIALFLLYLLYMPANMLLSYCFSFAFESHETCLMVVPNAVSILSLLPYIGIVFLDQPPNTDVATGIHMLFSFINPGYVIFGGFHYIVKIHNDAVIAQKTENVDVSTQDYFQWSSNIPVCFLASALHIVLLGSLLLFLDVRQTSGSGTAICRKTLAAGVNRDFIQNEDDDVAAERKRVDLLEQEAGPMSFNNKVAVLVKNLRKEFRKSTGSMCDFNKTKEELTKVAVRNNTFAVNNGEVFGMLGPNGAGKTTTLNSIIAEIEPTAGKIMIGGEEVTSSISEAFQMMGYCPQHDPLWETITLKEHIECFAALKGVLPGDCSILSKYFVDNLQLKEHENKKAKELSGGTKRKLCYILSMLGNSTIILLDEPSTGLDPKAKRFLWDTISSAFKSDRRGAILTTHSMEEADALCSRIAIMVNGEMKCLGSSQHLKDKFGSGYTLEVKLRPSQQKTSNERFGDLLQLLVQKFPSITIIEQFGERASFKILKEDGQSLSKAFNTLELLKPQLDIEEYSYSQATLEQVFISFAKKQQDKDESATNERVGLTNPAYTV